MKRVRILFVSALSASTAFLAVAALDAELPELNKLPEVHQPRPQLRRTHINSQENAVIALHARSHTSKTGPPCGSAAPTIPCSLYRDTWPTRTPAYVYLVVAKADSVFGIAGLSCGIDYDDTPGTGIKVYSWASCPTNQLPFESTFWPAPGGGLRITWLDCETTVRGSDGGHTIVGAFYLYSYGDPQDFAVTYNTTVMFPELSVADCNAAESHLSLAQAGRVSFTNAPTTYPGYNPCTDCTSLVCLTSSIEGQGAAAPDSAEVVLTVTNCSSYEETVSGSFSVEGGGGQAMDLILAASASQDVTMKIPCRLDTDPDTLTVIASYTAAIGPGTSCSVDGSETTEVVCLPPSCLRGRAPVSGDIVAWWSLDELLPNEALPIPDLVHPGSKKNWGALVSSASLVPGFVGNALRCQTPTDGVQVPHSGTSGLNFVNRQSFGIDAWIYPRSGAPAGVRRVILDKSQGNWSGYTFYLRDGKLGLEVQRPGNPGVYETGAQVTEDAWHLVVVVADRSGWPAQSHVRFYLDGVQIYSVDPPYFEATGSNDLYIGRIGEGGNPAGAFLGDIDEVEMWSPPPDSSTIAKLWGAGCAGKRKEYVRLPMISPQCQSDGSARICALLCNMSMTSQVYNWSAVSGPHGSTCASVPLVFSPDHGTLAVDAGTCSTIPIDIQATGSPPFKTCYHVDVVNVADPQDTLTANGSLNVPAGKLCVKTTKCSVKVIEPLGLAAGKVLGGKSAYSGLSGVLSSGGRVIFRVYNDSTDAVPFDYTLIAWDEGTGTTSQHLSMNGQPPGTPVTGTVLVPPADSVEVGVGASVEATSPFFTESVLLLRELGGGGRRDSLATALIEFPEDTTSSVVGVPEEGAVPTTTRILAVPNPFASRTEVELALAEAENVAAGVYDLTGRQVRLLHTGPLPAGNHRLKWDGLDMTGRRCQSGIYFIRVERGGVRLGTKVFLLR